MSLAMRPEEWLGYIRREYLESFIREGSASAKFCVPRSDAERVALRDGMRSEALAAGYLFAAIDAAQTRVNLADQLFFAMAAQVDWELLGSRVLVDLCKRNNFEPPDPSPMPFCQAVSERNGIDPKATEMLLLRNLTDQVFRSPDLVKEFRIAMFSICHAQLTGAPDGTAAVRALREWLTGKNRNVSAVKPYGIYNRITRTNARHFIESLSKWVRMAGLPGTVILMDIARLATLRNPNDELIYYTTAGLLDAYEVLREFIDATDRLAGCLLVVMPDASFVDEDAGRGIGRYQALKFRITDEVRAQVVNPLGSLVRIALDTWSIEP